MNKPSINKILTVSSFCLFIYFSDVSNQVKGEVNLCLANSDNSEVINVGINKFVEKVNSLDNSEITHIEEFIDKMINISKKTIPNLTHFLESAKTDFLEYNKFLAILFENGFFVNPYEMNILKLDSYIDVENTVPELKLLFGDKDLLKSAKIGRLGSVGKSNVMGCVNGSVGVIVDEGIKNVYEKVVLKITSGNNSFSDISYEDKVKGTIANEATHSILINGLKFPSIKQPLNKETNITFSEMHEFLSDTGSLCVNGNHLVTKISSILGDVQVDGNEIFIGEKNDAKSYGYSSNFLFDILSKLHCFREISYIFIEQYNANVKNGKINSFEDTDRIERAKKIIEKLSNEDIIYIRLAYINKGREFLGLLPIDAKDLRN